MGREHRVDCATPYAHGVCVCVCRSTRTRRSSPSRLPSVASPRRPTRDCSSSSIPTRPSASTERAGPGTACIVSTTSRRRRRRPASVWIVCARRVRGVLSVTRRIKGRDASLCVSDLQCTGRSAVSGQAWRATRGGVGVARARARARDGARGPRRRGRRPHAHRGKRRLGHGARAK